MSSDWKQNEIVIVGAGLAGLFLALKLSPAPVTIVTSAPLGKGASSSWAQGGIAAALEPGDTVLAHAADTLRAGAHIGNFKIANILTSEAATRIEDLLSYGVPFDRNLEGDLLLSKEAAHSARRVVRVKGDRAGWAIMNALIKAVRATPFIQVIEGYSAKKLDVKSGAVIGLHAWSKKGKHLYLSAPNIILAAGGAGALYKITTNPAEANGEAMAMAAKAGAALADTEFMQFHPTAINASIDPSPLATEALRGEGATLINNAGERFMSELHEDGELAPRDIVARAVFRENVSGRGAFLDCRKAIGKNFKEHFPSVYKKCQQAGIDPVNSPIPIAPAAHFYMGGIFTNELGRTSINGLWACGEVASTGAHGANRLASNSLLEAVVFAARIAKDLSKNAGSSSHQPESQGSERKSGGYPETLLKRSHQKAIKDMRNLMDLHVGIERNEQGMELALAGLVQWRARHKNNLTMHNMATTAKIITVSALLRTESRGGHYRTDYPEPDPQWAHRTMIDLHEIDMSCQRILNSR